MHRRSRPNRYPARRRRRTGPRMCRRHGPTTSPGPVPVLWLPIDRRGHNVVHAAASTCLLERQLMSCPRFQRSGSPPPGASRVGWTSRAHGGRGKPRQSHTADRRGGAGARQPDQRSATHRRSIGGSLRLEPQADRLHRPDGRSTKKSGRARENT